VNSHIYPYLSTLLFSAEFVSYPGGGIFAVVSELVAVNLVAAQTW